MNIGRYFRFIFVSHPHNKQTVNGQPQQESDNDSYTDDTVVVAEAGAAAAGPPHVNVITPLLVPQIVGAGLRGLFELIGEARAIQPALCTRALRALFDVIQGQAPEAFRAEPADMIHPLYELLLDLATMQPTAAVAATPAPASAASSSSGGGGVSVLNLFSSSHHQQQPHQQQQQQHHQRQPGTSQSAGGDWSAVGCAALLGLCVARGDTGKTLCAIAALLMSGPPLAQQSIQLPLVLGSLQRSIVAVALGRPTRPDWLRNGVPRRALLAEFTVAGSAEPAPNGGGGGVLGMAAVGRFVYVLLAGRGLWQIGSGYGGTLAGHVYNRNEDLGRDATAAWIGVFGGTLYYKRLSRRPEANDILHMIDQHSLHVVGGLSVRCPVPPQPPPANDDRTAAAAPATAGGGLVFSDGDALYALCALQSQVMGASTHQQQQQHHVKDVQVPSPAAGPPQTMHSRDGAGAVDSLVVRLVCSAPTKGPSMGFSNGTTELTLKLARKNFRTLGYAAFEEEVLSAKQIQEVRCMALVG